MPVSKLIVGFIDLTPITKYFICCDPKVVKLPSLLICYNRGVYDLKKWNS